ncbi:MAG: ATP-binding cassette domain-containing protein [Streptosporangiales bacterium]|nr:ATP-binding cassette domain-containing protein [Streptosporangiales bacterium]
MNSTAAQPGTPDRSGRLGARDITLGYDQRPVITGLDIDILHGGVTAIVGPNACGKSTLLRGLARLLHPIAGHVVLDGEDIQRLPTRLVARRLGLLPQTSIAPEGISVADLVARGRFPHQGLMHQWSRADEEAVIAAMTATGVTELSGRLVDELSGGQRQRVWVAMVLAQDTELVLLDEPTTFLDISHQVELLDLLVALNRDRGRTVVAVLHDLNHACRFADQLVVMHDGTVVIQGDPVDIVTAELIEHVYGLSCTIIDDPLTGTPLVIPRPSKHTRIRR